jgi:hypothetical protein
VPCLALPRFALPCSALVDLTCLALNRFHLPCLALPFLALPCLALPCLDLPCLALLCLALPCLNVAFPYISFPRLTLPCTALPFLALLCLAFPFAALPCLASLCLALPCLGFIDLPYPTLFSVAVPCLAFKHTSLLTLQITFDKVVIPSRRSKLHTNLKIQTEFCGHSSQRKIQNNCPPVYFRSSKKSLKWSFIMLTGNVSNFYKHIH